jgi:predicted PurR-regulated permease PerM
MDAMLVVIIVLVLVVGFGLVLFVMNQRLKELKNGTAVELMKGDVTELARTIAALQQTMGDKLERSSANVQQSVQKQLAESTIQSTISTKETKHVIMRKHGSTKRAVNDLAS